MPNREWLIRSRNEFEIHGHAIQKHVIVKQTRYQYVEIVDTFNYGRVLLLDGIPQSSKCDEFIYHEALVHPTLCAHPNPKDVLIIGGGEGAILREVLKHSTVEHVVMVDIDSELNMICRELLLDWHQGAFDNDRTLLCFEDGRQYLENNKNSFDCIILDLSDPFEGGPAKSLFTVQFYELVRNALRKGGLVSLQAEKGELGHNNEHCRIIHTLRQVFINVFPYYTYTPIYSSLYGFAICGDKDLTKQFLTSEKIDNILMERGVKKLKFYDSETAKGLFSIPVYIREKLMDESIIVITDANPLIVSS